MQEELENILFEVLNGQVYDVPLGVFIRWNELIYSCGFNAKKLFIEN